VKKSCPCVGGEVIKGSKTIPSFILKPWNRWGRRESFTTRLFYSGGKETPVSIEHETRWAPETVWLFWWRANAYHCQVWIHRSSSQWYNHSTKWQISSNRHWDISIIHNTMSRDSSVVIATRYGLYGPGIESRWGMRFSALVQTGPEANPAPSTMSTGSFPGGKTAGVCLWPHPHLAPRLKKE